jgi:hypothetical protein
MSAVAFLSGSSRTRMIVSERPPMPAPPSFAFLGRLSEPSSMIVCGSPGSVSAMIPGCSLMSFSPGLRALTTLSTSRNAATDVADAVANTTSAPPIRNRFHSDGRGMSSKEGVTRS